jgi:hypothetical protein
MNTAAKIIWLGICCLALAFSQHANAQPVFQAASVDSAALGNRIPLILIHGIESDPSMWNNFLNYYSTHPALQNNFKPYTFGYKTDENSLTSSDPGNIFGLTPILGKDLEQTFGTKPVAILAHSMGGLVARAEMEYYSYADKTRGGDRVLMLITLATPHHGTPLANAFVDTYVTFSINNTPISITPVTWILNLAPGFGYNMEWDGYDGNNIDGDEAISAIPSSQDYSKIIAYGGSVTSDSSIPSQDQGQLKPGYDLIGLYYGYSNDGAVPIGSALFGNANGVRTRQVDGSCDHFEIYSGQKTVNGGTPIFDSIAADLATVVPISVPASPVISSVSPSTLTGLPVGQTQLIRVIGSGFTGSSTLTFNDGVNPSYTGKIPSSETASELDYYISVGTSQANWTVQVVNGGQTSNFGYFTVNPPPVTPSGSLVVNLSPANIGGQWQVNGTYYDSGSVANPLAPGQYTVSFKPVSGYTTPANQTVAINANAQTTTNATYTAVAPTTYTLTLNANSTQGGVSASPTASGNSYNSGSVVQLTAYANSGYHFTGWSGDLIGSISPTNITINSAKNITANFASGDPNLATVTVTIKPDAAATAGVTWSVTGDSQLRASGSSLSEAVGSGYTTYLPVTLNLVAGWLGTNGVTSFNLPITAGITTNVTLICAPNTTPGLLTVTLTPPDAVTAGAHWHVNGGTYGQSTSVSLPPGNYTVTFDSVSGWTAPASQPVTIQPSGTVVLFGNYTPPAGQPVIDSISPPIGPNAGGTVMTINGANFSATTNVLVGGKPATNISVSSATQITCLTPSSTTNGSVPVVVQTTGGNATNSSGFAYGIAYGNKLTLTSAVGGSAYGVAALGGYTYVGEGRNFVVLNTSAPSSPSKIIQLTLPGIVTGIKLLNQYAYVSDGEGGLQVVDISNPMTPKIAGFYSTTNYTWATSVYIYGGRAYVSDQVAGLEIFDLGNPTMPALLSSTNFGGLASDIVVTASPNGVFAYLSAYGTLYVVDVSQPTSPVLRGQTSMSGVGSITVLGNLVFGGSSSDDSIHMVNVSNPSAPTDSMPSAGGYGSCFPVSVTAANNYLFVASWLYGFLVFNVNGTNLTLVGQNSSILSDSGLNDKMILSGNQAYIAAGSLGLQIADVSNPYSPAALGSFNDSQLYGQPLYVAVTANSLCVANGNIRIFDASQPGQLTPVSSPSAIVGGRVVAGNGLAYARAQDGTRIYSLATPSSPQLKATISNSVVYAADLQLSGTMLYSAGYVGGSIGGSTPCFVATDVSTPSSPVVRGTKNFSDTSAFASCLAVSGNKALIGIQGNNSNRISFVDVSNVGSPVERASLNITNTWPRGIRISPDGNYAYFIQYEYPSFVHVINLTNLASPLAVTNIPLDNAVSVAIEQRGNELYAATGNGLYVFDISNPAMPILTRSYLMSDINEYGGICAPTDSTGQSAKIYVADSSGGIVALQEQDIQAPDIYITDPIFGSTWTTTTSSTELGGGSDDNVGVTAITWSNNRGGSGQVSAPLDNWFVSGIKLYPGTNILTVTAFDAAGNSGTNALTVVYQTTNQNQTITFQSITNHTFGDAPIPLVAAASSGLPVTFSVISGAASISNNILTLTGAGAVTVEADQSGNNLFNPATPVDVSFNVARANQAIAFAPVPNHPASDPPFALAASTSSGLPVYFAILSGPALISSNMVTLAGAGAVTLVAYQPGNSNYNAAATVQQSFSVSQIPQTITFGALSPQKVGDAPFPLNASASSGLPVGFAVSGPAILSGNILTVTGYGTVTVTASQPGNSSYAAAANVSQSFAVAPSNNTLLGLGFQNGGFQMAFYGMTGSNYTFNASSNLLNWQPFTNFNLATSPFYFSDPAATNFRQRFYRLTP